MTRKNFLYTAATVVAGAATLGAIDIDNLPVALPDWAAKAYTNYLLRLEEHLQSHGIQRGTRPPRVVHVLTSHSNQVELALSTGETLTLTLDGTMVIRSGNLSPAEARRSVLKS